MSDEMDVRPSPIAGMWYSDDPARLAAQVDDFIAQARLPEIKGDVLAVVAPHAGLRYSGRTAGHAFACLKGQQKDLVVVLSPLHEYHPAPFLTSAHPAYGTPLGRLEVDQTGLAFLDERLLDARIRPLARLIADPEHSLEIELPFLQRALQGNFQLLPLMIRARDPRSLEIMAQALADYLRERNAVIVASSDLSHFYPQNVGEQLDQEILRRVEAFSPNGVLEAQEEGKGFACGASAIATALWTAQSLGANAAKILHHSTSADETGDTTSVVGYGSAVIYRRAEI